MAQTSERGVWDQDPPGSERAAGPTFVNRRPGPKQVAQAKAVRDDWDDDDDEDDEQQQVGATAEKGVNGYMAKAITGRAENDGAAPRSGLNPGSGPLGRREREADECKGEEDSSKIWEEANKKAPMPELVVAPASTSQSAPPPPPAALQPTLRILKRPSPNTSANSGGVASSATLSSSSLPGAASGPGSNSGSGGTSPAPRGTLAEREAQYQEARSRIFGEKEKVVSTSGNAGPSSNSTSRSGAGGTGVVVVRDPLGPALEPEVEPGTSANGQDKTHGRGEPAKGFGERRRGKK